MHILAGNWYRLARKRVHQKTVRHGPPTRGQPVCITRPTAIFVNHVYTKIYKLPAICPRADSEPHSNGGVYLSHKKVGDPCSVRGTES